MDQARETSEAQYIDALRNATGEFKAKLDSLQNAERLPKQLYHYTTASTMKSILDNRCFWATDSRYMNDSRELDHGMEIFRQAASDCSGEFDSHIVREVAGRLEDELRTVRIRQEVFMVCFCENPNLLSQWRAYGDPSGRGSVSLGFETHGLQALAIVNDKVAPDLHLAPVEYDIVVQRRIAEGITRRFYQLTSAQDKGTSRTRLSFGVERAVKSILSCAMLFIPRFKDPGFSEEREWRLSLTSSGRTNGINYRPSTFGLSPYRKIWLTDNPSEDGSGIKIPLRTVHIGPAVYSDLVASAVASYIKATGIEYCGVLQSGIPLRPF